MEQVPRYLIVGDGRMARHISFYFGEIGISYRQWARRTHGEGDFRDLVDWATHVLILISDGAIESFIKEHGELRGKKLVHFSGSLVTPLAYGVHPLMTFSRELYELEDYKRIPFVCDLEGPGFGEIFPGLGNPHYVLPKALKARYHALCVMSNNFTTLLWQKFYREVEETLGMPGAVIYPYLEQTFKNLKSHPKSALTGPLVREDKETIAMNLKALEGDPFRGVYEAFLEVYKKL